MTTQKRSKGLHIGLWVVQGLLALAFGMAGFMKISAPAEELVEAGMGFVNDFGVAPVRFIGISEILGAIGLILPAALRIKPNLTPIAASALSIVMVLATTYHITNSEPFIPTVVLLVLTLFVAWGRFKKAPILPK